MRAMESLTGCFRCYSRKWLLAWRTVLAKSRLVRSRTYTPRFRDLRRHDKRSRTLFTLIRRQSRLGFKAETWKDGARSTSSRPKCLTDPKTINFESLSEHRFQNTNNHRRKPIARGLRMSPLYG